MAQDVYVKEADALYAFAGELRSLESSLAGHCLQLSGAVSMKESQLRGYVAKVEVALQEAEQKVNTLRREYENYIYHSDCDSYSEWEARSLLEELQYAEARYAEVNQDWSEATRFFQESCYVLSELDARTRSFMSRSGQLLDEAGNRVDRAAYDICQYQNVK